jgi:ribosomal protein S19E (S16A)
MTDMQVRARANQLEAEKLEETHRANVAKEELQDSENLVKYGMSKYTPVTDAGWFARRAAANMPQLVMDYMKQFGQFTKGVYGSVNPLVGMLSTSSSESK